MAESGEAEVDRFGTGACDCQTQSSHRKVLSKRAFRTGA